MFRLLEGKQRPAQTRDLYFIAGIVCGLLAKASHDLGRAHDAMAQARTLYVCADNADHPGLRAWARGLQSLIAYWAGRPQESVRYAQAGTDLVTNLNGSVAAWLPSLETRAWALLAAPDEAAAAIGRAADRRAEHQPDDLDHIGGVLSFPPARQHYYAAGAYLFLEGEQTSAQREAATVIGIYETGDPQQRSFSDEAGAHAELALSRVNDGELEGAHEALAPVLDLEPERRIGGIVASAARVHGALRTPTYTASPVARGIREEIEAFCQVPGCSAARVMTVSPASGGDRQGVYPVSVDGPRVRLRDFQESDLGGCMTIVGDPQVTWYLSFDSRSHEQQAALLAADIARAQTSPRPDYYFAAIEKATDTMIGFARLGLDRPRTAELGYAIRRDRWGAGYATEVAMVMLRYGYSTLGLHRVQAACGPDNTASQRVLVKLGFTYEGRMREHVFTNGAWRDSLLYSLLEQEWVALERNATLPIRATGEQPTR